MGHMIWLMVYFCKKVTGTSNLASNQKIQMSISVLLGLTVYLFLLAKRTPETSLAIPLISRFLMFAMVAVTCSIVSSGKLYNLQYVMIQARQDFVYLSS